MKTPRQVELAMQMVIVAFAEKIRIGRPSIPTATHSLRVGLSLIAYGYPMEVCLGGFMHDIKEDTLLGEEFIKELFGDRVHFLMCACSLDPHLEEKEGEQELYERVLKYAEEGDGDPLRIKCADSLDNLRTNSLLKMEWQIEAVEKGKRWLHAAQRFFYEESLVGELEYMVNREVKRIASLTPVSISL